MNDYTKTFLEDFYRRTSIDLNNQTTIENIKNQFYKNSNILVFLLISVFIIFYVSYDQNALVKYTYLYGLLIMIPIIIGLYINTNLSSLSNASASSSFLTYGLILLSVTFVFYFYFTASSSTLAIMNYINSILITLIILVGLAILYFTLNNYLKKQTGAAGFLINLIFYIPCLLFDFFTYIKEELKITPSVVYILFIIELLLIALYVYVPKLINTFAKLNTNILLMKPSYLNNESVIANSSHFLLKDTPYDKNLVKRIDYRNSNYAVSFWVYVNPGSPSQKNYVNESNIFNYANGKPQVTYVNDGKNHNNKFIVYFSNRNREQAKYEIDAENQKWNYFVFNYHDNKSDLFVNGKLLRTFHFENETIPLDGMDNDTITIGQIDGLDGAICNINYYTTPLPISQIANTYNILAYKNPPVTKI